MSDAKPASLNLLPVKVKYKFKKIKAFRGKGSRRISICLQYINKIMDLRPRDNRWLFAGRFNR